MAPHSSALAWKTSWTEEPGRLRSMGSLRVGHDWVTSLSLFTFMHWRRKWQPTPVFLPRESQGRGSLVGCRLWGRTESDTTERLNWTELNAYTWNLERWHWRIYLQGSNGETNIENRLMEMERREERVRYMERVTWKLILPYVKQIANGNLLYGSGNSNRDSVLT